MLQTTRGIIFKTVKYSESSMIAKIFTEQFGLQSYMVRGLRSKKSTVRKALFQQLTLVELVCYYREKKEIQNLKEIRIETPFKHIPFDIRKSSVLLFMNEILYHVIREEEANAALFAYLFNAIRMLDDLGSNVASFPAVFLTGLSRFLGFFPKNNYSNDKPNFNLMEGEFSSIGGPETMVAVRPFSSYIASLSNIDIGHTHEMIIPVQDRRKLLEIMLNYYRHHIPGLREFKSHNVLQEVLE